MYRFSNDKEFSMFDFVNEEQLLDLVLDYLAMLELEKKPNDVAIILITSYVVNEFKKEGIKEFSEEQVEQRIKELITQHVLEGLVKKGIIEANIAEKGITYTLNEEYKRMFNDYQDG